MQNGKLSLEAFKAKANGIQTSEVLEKVQGGDSSDCHGAVSANHKWYMAWQELWE